MYTPMYQCYFGALDETEEQLKPMARKSILEVIGPIMVGPSSSHTAGAVRLGRIARAVLGSLPETAQIELHGSFASTGKGHGTDKAIVAGLLNMPTFDERIRDSFELANESGMRFEFRTVDFGENTNPNTARLVLCAAQQQFQITGSSVGGGMVEITNVQGYPVSFQGEYDTLIILANDQMGTINAITSWLIEREINVAFFRVERQKRGGQAMMTVETDQSLPDDLVASIADFDWVHWVRQVSRIEE